MSRTRVRAEDLFRTRCGRALRLGAKLARGLHLPELYDQGSGDLRDLHRMRSRAAHSRPRSGRREALLRLSRRDR